MQKLFILTVALLSAGLACPRESGAGDKPRPHKVPPGRGELHLRLGEVKLKVFTYRPKNFDPRHGPMVLTFHGQARDPEHYRDAAVKLARQCKGLVVAPLFDEEQFPGQKYMHGNVMEWCKDWYGKKTYRSGEKRNPQGPATGTTRVMRGGSFYDGADSRSAHRVRMVPSYRNDDLGFRVVLRTE